MVFEVAVIRNGLVKEQVSLLLGTLADAVLFGRGAEGGLWADGIELRMKRRRRREEENLEEITFLCHLCC